MSKLKILIMAFCVIQSYSAVAANNGYPLEDISISLHNMASLQRGAKYFVNYCLSCHSAQYSRYSKIARDLGIPEDVMKENMMFTKQKIGDLMTISMTAEESLQWFGAAPPDLTLVARSRSPEWLYTYLKSFYLDSSRPMGVNNALFTNVAMPHVLWELQGWQVPEYKTVEREDGSTAEVISGFKIIKAGSLSESDYNKVVLDLVTFLAYLSEPVATKRVRLGVFVLFFLFVFLGVAYFLKQEYWKDIK